MAKKLPRTAPTEDYLRQGEESQIRLKMLGDCEGIAGGVKSVTDALRAAESRRRAAEEALLPIRVRCSFANFAWDRGVRSAAANLEADTGGKRSKAYREVFPEGVSPMVVPIGETQRAVAEQFLLHLGTCSTPEARAFAEEWMPKLRSAFEALSAALAERKQAEAGLYVARGEEQAAKRDFNRAIDKAIAEVRAVYPEDLARQSLAFPSLEYGSRGEEDDELSPSAPAEPE